MKKALHAALLAALAVALARAQGGGLDGEWIMAHDVYGNTLYRRLTLEIEGRRPVRHDQSSDDRNVAVGAKLRKERLAALKQ